MSQNNKSQYIQRYRWLIFIGLFLSIGSSAFAKRNTYDIEFRSAELRDAVRMLAYVDGKNVIIPENINNKVTVSFNDITVKNAMDSILDVNDMGLMLKGRTIRVATNAQLEKIGGDLITHTISITYAKAGDLIAQLEPLLSKRGSVVADPRTNSVTINDKKHHITNVERLISNVDVPERQVLLEAKVIQTTDNILQSLGIQWGVTRNWNGSNTLSGLTGVGTSEAGRPLIVNKPAENFNTGIGLFLGSIASPIDIQLSAAEERGDLKIISRPSIVTMNNRPAIIKSGIKFFVKTSGDVSISGSGGTSATAGSNLQEIDAGITLAVTPQISLSNFIKLVINVTQSEPDFGNKVEDIPSIIENTAETTVFLKDGETTVIGGLLQSSDSYTTKGIPGISSVPVLGALFGSLSSKKKRTELIILIRPTIVSSRVDGFPMWDE